MQQQQQPQQQQHQKHQRQQTMRRSKRFSGVLLLVVIICLHVPAECIAIRNLGANNNEISINVHDMISHCKPQVAINVVFPHESVTHKVLLTLATSPGTEPLIVTTNSNNLKSPCLYHGFNSVTKESLFAHEASGYLRSTFQSRGRWYKMKRPIHSTEPATHAVPIRLYGSGKQAANKVVRRPNLRPRYRLLRRETKAAARHPMRLASFNGVAAMRVLELVVVAESGYVKKYGGHSKAIARILKMINYVNGAYQAIGLQVVLVQAVTLKVNPFNVAQPSEALLRDFSTFKAFNIDIRHDAAILLISTKMTGPISPGLVSTKTLTGWFNGLCHTFDSSGVVSDIGTPIHTAWLIAQTLGGLLGFSKDEDVPGCRCPAKNGCVMSHELSTEYSDKLVMWSTCSVEVWLTHTNAFWRSCLNDAPELSFPYNSVSLCGNGIIDLGEECDCGPVETCKHLCCEPSTCRFRAGAVCASGACCNTATCRLWPRGHVCRPKLGPCDVAESCDGATEWCPTDDRVADGHRCANDTFCFGGECKSRGRQCKSLYGPLATEADSKCFRTINVLTNAGFCHKTLMGLNNTRRVYSVVRCPAVDAMCGLLHCTMPERPQVGDTYHLGEASCSNQWTIDTSSSGQRSPAMVPDGASCGSTSMCVNSTCQPLSKFACPDCPNCHGNGVLTRSKLCYCNPGFAPPDCKYKGCGGSMRSLLGCDEPKKKMAKPKPVVSSDRPTFKKVSAPPKSVFATRAAPTLAPIIAAKAAPTLAPIIAAKAAPTLAQIIAAKAAPTLAPITAAPTLAPITAAKAAPTLAPIIAAKAAPTLAPIATAKAAPTLAQIATAKAAPTLAPITAAPTLAPIATAKTAPTLAPIIAAKAVPTLAPITTAKAVPTLAPITAATAVPQPNQFSNIFHTIRNSRTKKTHVETIADTPTLPSKLSKLNFQASASSNRDASNGADSSFPAAVTVEGPKATAIPPTSRTHVEAAPTMSSPKKSQLPSQGPQDKPQTAGLFSGAVSKQELLLVLPTILLSILVPLIAIAFIISAAVILVKVV